MDLCSREGAEELRRRIIAARTRQGVPVGNLHVVRSDAKDTRGYAVWGVRDRPVVVANSPVLVKTPVRGSCAWHTAAKALCINVLQDYPEVPLDVILEGAGRRALVISAARRACIRAVHAMGIAPTRQALAAFFRVDQSSISLAVNHGRRKDREALAVAA